MCAHQTVVPTFKFKVVNYCLIRWYTTATARSPGFSLSTTNMLPLMFTTFRLGLTVPATPTPSNHSMPSILQSIFETPPTPCNSWHCATKKWSWEDQDENLPFASSAPPKKCLHTALQFTPSPGALAMPQQYIPCQTKCDKLNSLFDTLDAVHWTLREFLYYTFSTKDEHGVNIHWTVQHSKYSQHFLQGTSKHTPATILNAWFWSLDGHISEGSLDVDLMYSINTLYRDQACLGHVDLVCHAAYWEEVG